MKTLKSLIFTALMVVAAALMVSGCSTTQESAVPARVSRPPAFPELVGYGDWIESTAHGWVWKPFVLAAWQPYSYGHWVWSDQGWLWVGYEDFSWLVDHYGFWDFDAVNGWVWIPGNQWSPSRVRWYSGDGYVGWAPLSPPGGPVTEPWDATGGRRWVVVQGNAFHQENIGRYRDRSAPPRTGTYTGTGPDVHWVQQQTGRTVAPIKIETQAVDERKGGRVRVLLPDEERRKVESHRDEIERDALAPSSRHPRGDRDEHRVNPVTPPPPPPSEAPRPSDPLPVGREKRKDDAGRKNVGRDERPRTDTPAPVDIRRDPTPGLPPVQAPVVKEPTPPVPAQKPVVKAPELTKPKVEKKAEKKPEKKPVEKKTENAPQAK